MDTIKKAIILIFFFAAPAAMADGATGQTPLQILVESFEEMGIDYVIMTHLNPDGTTTVYAIISRILGYPMQTLTAKPILLVSDQLRPQLAANVCGSLFCEFLFIA